MNEKVKIVKGTREGQLYALNYQEQEKDNRVVISAKIVIEKNNPKAQSLIEKASKRETSPLTMALKDYESQRRRDKRHDE